MDDGEFYDVLCVPSLLANILSIYHITLGGAGRSVESTQKNFIIWDLYSRYLDVAREVEHQSCIYTLSHFSPNDLVGVHIEESRVNTFEEI